MTIERSRVRLVPLSQRARAPAETLDNASKLCDPYTPLDPVEDDVLREDLTAIRGSDRLARVEREIRRAGSIPSMQFLSGHTGSGKTTELLRMRCRLIEPRSGAGQDFQVLQLDAERWLDLGDVELEDILMALWAVVYEMHPAVAARVLTPLWAKSVRDVIRRLITTLPEQALAAVMELIKHLRVPGRDEKEQLRDALGSVVRALIDGLNAALEAIRVDGPVEVVVLIDNLEKLSTRNLDVVERLFADRLRALRALEAHLIITVPLHLCYSPLGAQLEGPKVVLPMVKVRDRVAVGGGDSRAGLETMVRLLARRVNFARLFADGPEAARKIARLSGGVIRDALRLVRNSINEQDDPPVLDASIDVAIASLQGDYERGLEESWVPILRAIAADNQFPLDCPHDVKQRMLRGLYVLEYQNGDPEPWYGVHPLVERTRKYRTLKVP